MIFGMNKRKPAIERVRLSNRTNAVKKPRLTLIHQPSPAVRVSMPNGLEVQARTYAVFNCKGRLYLLNGTDYLGLGPGTLYELRLVETEKEPEVPQGILQQAYREAKREYSRQIDKLHAQVQDSKEPA